MKRRCITTSILFIERVPTKSGQKGRQWRKLTLACGHTLLEPNWKKHPAELGGWRRCWQCRTAEGRL